MIPQEVNLKTIFLSVLSPTPFPRFPNSHSHSPSAPPPFPSPAPPLLPLPPRPSVPWVICQISALWTFTKQPKPMLEVY
jgi:hypothetical protein